MPPRLAHRIGREMLIPYFHALISPRRPLVAPRAAYESPRFLALRCISRSHALLLAPIFSAVSSPSRLYYFAATTPGRILPLTMVVLRATGPRGPLTMRHALRHYAAIYYDDRISTHKRPIMIGILLPALFSMMRRRPLLRNGRWLPVNAIATSDAFFTLDDGDISKEVDFNATTRHSLGTAACARRCFSYIYSSAVPLC